MLSKCKHVSDLYARSAFKMKASSRVLLIHPPNDHAAVEVGARCVAGKSSCLHSLWCFPFVPKGNGQLFRELIIFDCPDLLDRAFCERLAFGKISVCQLYDLGLVFQKVKTDLAPFAVVVCPIGVDCGGDFFVFLLASSFFPVPADTHAPHRLPRCPRTARRDPQSRRASSNR